jgi:radical SAM protein with 4Fe4S-binding SPASM domain
MKTESYGAFSGKIHKATLAERKPLTVSLELTRRCPLECSHCYNNLPMGDKEARNRELSYGELCRVMDEISDTGCLWLLLTGGEILARPDFLDIYTYAKKKGFIITLFTNGTMMTEEIADYLATLPPFSIEITLYGRTRETYERLTRIPGSYDRCMQGIRLILDRKLPLKIKTVAVTINKHELWDMKRFVEEEIGGIGMMKFDAMMNPRVDCSQSPLEVRLSPEEVVELDIQDPARMAEWDQFAKKFVAPSPNREDIYNCGAALKSFAIDPYGRMTACILSTQESYDLRHGNVGEGWRGFLGRVRGKKITRITKCTDCQIKAICGMCPANGELHSEGDPEKPVDFLCETAHLRANIIGLNVPAHGDCEFCAGGKHHDELLATVGRLKDPALRPTPNAAPPKPKSLKVMKDAGAEDGGCSTGGCSSCL